MKLAVLVGAGIALLAAGVVAAVVAAGGGSEDPVGQGDAFTVVERVVSEGVTDTGKPGVSPGDILYFANDLYDAENRTKVGTDHGFCLRTIPGKQWECSGTFFFANGRLTFEGPVLDFLLDSPPDLASRPGAEALLSTGDPVLPNGSSALVITGGSGKYTRAGGWLEIHPRDDDNREYDFVFHIEKS